MNNQPAGEQRQGGSHRLIQMIWKRFPAGCRVLDLGCGSGEDALFLARNGFQVTAVDADTAAIGSLQKRAEQGNVALNAVCSDARAFAIAPATYAVVICKNLLQFLPRPEVLRLIRECQEKVLSGGLILFSSFTTDDPSARGPKPLPTYFALQEMLHLFSGFAIIHYLENTILDQPHQGAPTPHQHGVVSIIAQKRR